eukprot:PLAT3526.7.p1 GENE.PLAT3526.7~~PLAT3526.7.p1  ORF type:complete len:300 (-),score=89.87 PLAT3526.7:148-1047(-)
MGDSLETLMAELSDVMGDDMPPTPKATRTSSRVSAAAPSFVSSTVRGAEASGSRRSSWDWKDPSVDAVPRLPRGPAKTSSWAAKERVSSFDYAADSAPKSELDDLLSRTGALLSDSSAAAPAASKRPSPYRSSSTSYVDSLAERAGGGGGSGSSSGGSSAFAGAASGSSASRSAASGAGRLRSGLATSVGSERCAPLCLGGSAASLGLCTSRFRSKACDNLLCTNCEFRVIRLPGRRWAPSVDYLFLRNAVPDEYKLSSKLLDSAEHAAYACQCSWRSVEGGTEVITSGADLRWTCAGH